MVDQTDFCAALLHAERSCPAGLIDGQGAGAGRRFDVYRNNVAVSLAEALETAFPTLQKLLGAQNFRTMAAVFLRQHPPSSPLMMFYGEEMPAFLGEFGPTSSIKYLPDVARLELALRESYHAADADPIRPSDLESIPPEDLMAAKVSVAPALRLLRSPWPVHSIWLYNTEQGAQKPQMRAEDVMIIRPEFDPQVRLLLPGGGEFVHSLQKGETLGRALDAALASFPQFDLGAVLAVLLSGNAITSIGE